MNFIRRGCRKLKGVVEYIMRCVELCIDLYEWLTVSREVLFTVIWYTSFFKLLFQSVFNGGLLVVTNRVRYFSAKKAHVVTWCNFSRGTQTYRTNSSMNSKATWNMCGIAAVRLLCKTECSKTTCTRRRSLFSGVGVGEYILVSLQRHCYRYRQYSCLGRRSTFPILVWTLIHQAGQLERTTIQCDVCGWATGELGAASQ